jgi:hypothetical protein
MPDKKPICVYCIAEFPHEPTDICNDTEDQVQEGIQQAMREAGIPGVIGRPPKDNSDLVDPESAGRKRAAELLPKDLMKIMICEWAFLKEAGGGIHPIKGCPGNPATDRHHGPDKNTLHNQRGPEEFNLHAICAFCHNRWHAANDPTYVGERPKDDTAWIPVGEYKLHDPMGERMSRKEAIVEELKRL